MSKSIKILAVLIVVFTLLLCGCSFESEKYVITYYSDEAKSNQIDTSFEKGQSVNISSCPFRKDYYSFVEWNTASDGSGVSYLVGENYSKQENLVLYAIWELNSLPDLNIISPYSGSSKSILLADDVIFLSCNGFPEVEIFYSLDGTEPTRESSVYDENGIQIPRGKHTLKVIGYSGSISSAVSSMDLKVIDLFICGSKQNDEMVTTACYWQNNSVEPVFIGDGLSQSSATAVFKDATTLFLYSKDKRWVNGVEEGIPTINIQDGCLVNGVPYVVGTTPNGLAIKAYALYGLNPVSLEGTNENKSSASGICVSDGDIYICGYISDTNTWWADDYYACYWKNGDIVRLGDSSVRSYASDIYVVGDDVYVCGTIYNASGEFRWPCYWKNGVLKKLDNSFVSTDMQKNNLSAVEIVVFDNQVIIAENSGYWIDEVFTKEKGRAYVATMLIVDSDLYIFPMSGDYYYVNWEKRTLMGGYNYNQFPFVYLE